MSFFQTDDRHTEYVYRQAINRHLLYYFVPSSAMLTAQMGELELVGDTPAILVKVTLSPVVLKLPSAFVTSFLVF